MRAATPRTGVDPQAIVNAQNDERFTRLASLLDFTGVGRQLADVATDALRKGAPKALDNFDPKSFGLAALGLVVPGLGKGAGAEMSAEMSAETRAAIQDAVNAGKKTVEINGVTHQILQHYSPKQGLTTLDPAFMGTGQAGAEAARGGRPGAIHYYAPGSPPEEQFKGLNQYFTAVPEDKILVAGSPEMQAAVKGARNANGVERKLAANGQYLKAAPPPDYVPKWVQKETPQIIKGFEPMPAFQKQAPVGPNPEVQAIAKQYVKDNGIESAPLPRVKAVNTEAAQRMASAYDALKSDPTNPDVISAYRKFSDEVMAQKAAIEDAGITFKYVDENPYPNSRAMMHDIRENGQLKVLKTQPGQEHPILTNAENDAFRGVHDFFGHAANGNQFGPIGEENAFRDHSAMFSPEARRVMATETRGQNSWVNFGPHSDLPVTERPYAEQKAALFPTEHMGEYPTSVAAPPASGSPPPLGQPDLVGDPLSTVSHYQYDHHWWLPDGNALTINAQPVGSTLHIHSIDATNGPGSVGPRVMRQAIQQLASKYGATDIAGYRATGINPGRTMREALPVADATPETAQAPAVLDLTSTLSKNARSVFDALTPYEQNQLTSGRVARGKLERFNEAVGKLEPVDVHAATAIAGSPTRGFYHDLVDAIDQHVGAEDRPRFAQLLAALSPRTQVENNVENALTAWDAWKRTGSAAAATEAVPMMMDSWKGNISRALKADDPTQLLTLSGPKVQRFARNSMGDPNEVTADGWMAALEGWNPRRFAGAATPDNPLVQANAPYLALTGRTRQAAAQVGMTPAETQAARWGYARALMESVVPGYPRVNPEAKFLQPGTLQRAVYGVGPAEFKASAPDLTSLFGQQGSPLLDGIGGAMDPSALQRVARNIERFTRGKYWGLGALGMGGILPSLTSGNDNSPQQ